jgi:hypothetical protein
MKIRNGFVSNSSSSSFCIYGAVIDEGILKKSHPEEEEGNLGNAMENLLQGTNLIYSFGPKWYAGVVVGRNFTSIKDDETGAQFKKSVEDKIAELFGEGIGCEAMEEGWMDN